MPTDDEVWAALVAYWGSKRAARKYGSEHDMRMALMAAKLVEATK